MPAAGLCAPSVAALYGVVRQVVAPGPPAGSGTITQVPGRAAPVLILMFINIHHYFTDGVIWKISNPEVRRDLFAHVQPRGAGAPAGAPTAAAAPASATAAAPVAIGAGARRTRRRHSSICSVRTRWMIIGARTRRCRTRPSLGTRI